MMLLPTMLKFNLFDSLAKYLTDGIESVNTAIFKRLSITKSITTFKIYALFATLLFLQPYAFEARKSPRKEPRCPLFIMKQVHLRLAAINAKTGEI
jgi:hypothetical protein